MFVFLKDLAGGWTYTTLLQVIYVLYWYGVTQSSNGKFFSGIGLTFSFFKCP